MKIICQKSNLLKSINISMRAVPSRTTMTILECVLINAATDIIKFITNDMEIAIDTVVEGQIVEKGCAAIDAKIFSEIIRKLPENEVTIFTDDSMNLIITCEKSRFSIPGKNPEDFIGLPFVEKNIIISLSQYTLKEMIRQTSFSIAVNENNPIMTGELFEINNQNLRIVSLDGHRISIRTTQIISPCPNLKVIIPGKTLNEISKILSGEIEDMVHIFITTNHIVFEIKDTIIVSRLIEGEYFKIDNMLSHDYQTKVTVNKRLLLESIERSSLFIKENDKKPIILKITDNEMILFIESAYGSMNESIDIEKDGKDLLIGFNPRFLLEALRVINEDEVSIYLMNSKAPCFFKDEYGSYTYLILPVNINQENYKSL